jgi:hypothetical protein
MAGGLTGSGHKAGALVKQQLATIRTACREANSRSNQDLILLLENYNDQVDQVIEALRSGLWPLSRNFFVRKNGEACVFNQGMPMRSLEDGQQPSRRRY